MENEALSKNFIEQIIDKDIESGHCKKVITLSLIHISEPTRP